ncbi:hypothetical protein RND81_08G210800 [Saponaria officinalis]|uniref:Uncharacterized protein n=1 Tax=Saponaria officinalis TaxID=3572 RepID=A0AAW1JBL8_SAPOF
MASSSSSSQTFPTHLLLNPYGGPTSAPPPTPSTQPPTTTATTVDTLTRLLHCLPPTLSLPTRLSLSPRAATTTTSHLPTITSLTSPTSNATFMSSLQLGYFQLSPLDHHVTPQLAESAESDSLSLLRDRNRETFPRQDWPLGYDNDNDDDNNDYTTSFCFTTTTTTELSTSLGELTRELEKVGLNVVEKLASVMGFENPFRENGSSTSMMWVSLNEGEKTGRVYPYVVGLEYQLRARKWSLVSDSGSVCVEPEVGSLLVTFGDIAQVWSNGKLKKVRGRPTPIVEDKSSHSISMTMLLTLPLDTMVSPLALTPTPISKIEASKPEKCRKDDDDDHRGVEPIDNNEGNEDDDENEDIRVFNSFSFEDYAWRVYYERLHFKDPLDRYRRLCD